MGTKYHSLAFKCRYDCIPLGFIDLSYDLGQHLEPLLLHFVHPASRLPQRRFWSSAAESKSLLSLQPSQ